MSLRLLNNPPLVFLQTFGRRHAKSIHSFEDGALDETSMLWANRILGNQNDDAVVEISFGNVSFLAEKDAHIALIGAEMPFSINEKDYPMQGTHFVKKGDILKFGYFSQHLRTYLSVRGGFGLSENFQGHEASENPEKTAKNAEIAGKKLKKDDRLFFTDTSSFVAYDRENDAAFSRCFPKSISSQYLPVYQDPLQLRLVEGYQSSLFSADLRQFFYDQKYLILGHSNSLAYHLCAPQFQEDVKKELLRWQLEPSPICYGTVSLSFDDEVVISLRDHFCLSSSPKIGSILPIDAHKLAQLSPGQRVCFLPYDLDDAQKVMHAYDSFFALNN